MLSMQVERRAQEYCWSYIHSFEASKASIEEMQTYSSCVAHLYPTGGLFTSNELIAIKVAMVLVLVGTIIGAIRGDDIIRNKFKSRIVGGLGGLIYSSMAMLCGAGLVGFVNFIFINNGAIK